MFRDAQQYGRPGFRRQRNKHSHAGYGPFIHGNLPPKPLSATSHRDLRLRRAAPVPRYSRASKQSPQAARDPPRAPTARPRPRCARARARRLTLRPPNVAAETIHIFLNLGVLGIARPHRSRLPATASESAYSFICDFSSNEPRKHVWGPQLDRLGQSNTTAQFVVCIIPDNLTTSISGISRRRNFRYRSAAPISAAGHSLQTRGMLHLRFSLQ